MDDLELKAKESLEIGNFEYGLEYLERAIQIMYENAAGNDASTAFFDYFEKAIRYVNEISL